MKLTAPQARALDLLKGVAEPVTSMQFAHLMWPDSDRKRHHLSRSAGGYLAKLRDRGWVDLVRWEDRAYRISDAGLKAHADHVAASGGKL